MQDPYQTARQKSAATYNAAADHFDAAPLAFWERYGRRTIERLQLPEGAKVLDAGCGSGASALPAVEYVGPSGHVIGIDVADRLLERARIKARRRGLGHAEFRRGDMTALEFENESFDAVVCVFAIFFVPDIARQAAELWRLVRPGGQLAITTWGPRFLEPASSIWWQQVGAERPDLKRAFNPWDHIIEPQAMRTVLNMAGVPDAQIATEEGSQPLTRAEDWWTVVLGCGYRWTVEQVGPEVAERLKNNNIRAIREHAIRAVETNALYATATKANASWRHTI